MVSNHSLSDRIEPSFSDCMAMFFGATSHQAMVPSKARNHHTGLRDIFDRQSFAHLRRSKKWKLRKFFREQRLVRTHIDVSSLCKLELFSWESLCKSESDCDYTVRDETICWTSVTDATEEKCLMADRRRGLASAWPEWSSLDGSLCCSLWKLRLIFAEHCYPRWVKCCWTILCSALGVGIAFRWSPRDQRCPVQRHWWNSAYQIERGRARRHAEDCGQCGEGVPPSQVAQQLLRSRDWVQKNNATCLENGHYRKREELISVQ